MDDLNRNDRIRDREAHKNIPQQPPTSSKSVLSETSEKIRTSAWITLAILGCTLLVTFYGETMLLPAIRDIIGDFIFRTVLLLGYLQHILSQVLLRLLLLESYLISMDERKWF